MNRPSVRLRLGVLLLLLATALPGGRAEASPIYNGGPVLTGAPDVYYIWYGDWSGNTATSILPNLITNLSGTSYMNIATSYSTGSYTVGNQVNGSGSYFISSTTNSSLYLGSSLDGTSTSQFQTIVDNVRAANPTWAADANAVFDVLTATGITVNGFNSGTIQFCGWHSSSNWGSGSLGTQYGFIGDPVQGRGCNASLQNAPSANGNFGADAMASVIAHELFETITDPTGTAWWDSITGGTAAPSGYENADMCAWQFGSTFTTGTGGNANVTLNGTSYLLQQQWLNQGGGSGTTGGVCTTSLALSLPAPEPASFAVLLPGLIGLAAMSWRRPLA